VWGRSPAPEVLRGDGFSLGKGTRGSQRAGTDVTSPSTRSRSGQVHAHKQTAVTKHVSRPPDKAGSTAAML
jgi:hypothetical protein